jgi:hypothetical protein
VPPIPGAHPEQTSPPTRLLSINAEGQRQSAKNGKASRASFDYVIGDASGVRGPPLATEPYPVSRAAYEGRAEMIHPDGTSRTGLTKLIWLHQ